MVPEVRSAPVTCYRCNVLTSTVKKLGLVDYAADPAIQFWGGMPDLNGKRSQYYKIVMSPCRGGEVISFYCFLPTEMTNHTEEGFSFSEVSRFEATVEWSVKTLTFIFLSLTLSQVPVSDILKGDYSSLDPSCVDLLKNSVDRMPWRLYDHQPYSHWFKGKTTLLGDSGHPMRPNQSQGACMAIEDAGVLGIIFKRPQFTQNVNEGLEMFQRLRKGRATRVQEASVRATENLNERIGFSSLNAHEQALAAGEGKLTGECWSEIRDGGGTASIKTRFTH